MGLLSRWFGKRHPAKEAVKTPEDEYHIPMPPGEGWRSWCDFNVSHEDMLLLYTADRVETWHEFYGFSIIKPREMQPSANVAGLWWRPYS